MSDTNNPIHAPLSVPPMRVNAQPPRPHPNQKGDAPRVRLSGGPFVDSYTLAQMAAWHQQGPSFGELVDRLTAHAQATGFDPTKKQNPAPLPEAE
jgi:hypothetical protein